MEVQASAVWSDGQPVLGQDFLVTYRMIMNPNFDITDRTGWEDIQSVKAKGKSVTMTFKKGKPVAFWDSMAGNQLMPRQQVQRIMNSKTGAGLQQPVAELDASSRAARTSSRAGRRDRQLTIVKNPGSGQAPAGEARKDRLPATSRAPRRCSRRCRRARSR